MSLGERATRKDYRAALRQVESLTGAAEGSPVYRSGSARGWCPSSGAPGTGPDSGQNPRGLPACDLEIVTGLEIQPELWCRPEIGAKPKGGVGCHRTAAPDDIVDADRRHPQLPREAIGGQAEGLQKIPLQNIAGVHWPKSRHSLVLNGSQRCLRQTHWAEPIGSKSATAC